MRKHLIRALRRIAGLLALVLVVAYLAQAPFRSSGPAATFELVAHRGVHQTFHTRGLDNETCTAERIDPPRHGFLENTLPSMQAAFDAGASRIELDVHRTADHELAVFHDWRVECRTEGSGETRSLALPALKQLDIGHGYTADGGASFPFRGQGTGKLPSLGEVLAAFPDGHFMIDQKDRSPATTARIVRELQASPTAVEHACLSATRELNAEFRAALGAGACTIADRHTIKSCLMDYLLFGWTGTLPESCRGETLTVLDGGAMRVLWGWPGSFIGRVHAHGGRVLVLSDDPGRVKAWDSHRSLGQPLERGARSLGTPEPGTVQSLGQPLKRGARSLGTPEPGTEAGDGQSAWDSH